MSKTENYCPICNNYLHIVERSLNSPLSKEQFDSIRAGDYYCSNCKGTRGETGYRYFWKDEVKDATD